MAFFKGEPAGGAVETFIQQAANEKTRLLLCVVNWGEIYYGMWRAGGKAVADAVAEDLSRLPLELVDADLPLSRQAAIFKATRKMSYTDCYAAALAKVKNCELLTGDAEFKEVEKEVKIRWLEHFR
jgi:predicted nucleic acid-binding protein